jgi:hypothetical protein
MAKKAAGVRAKQQRSMSDEHKAALAEGREQGRVVRRYLESLESHRPKRGRRRTAESIAKRLAAIDERLAAADPLSRLHLLQERMDLQQQLENENGGGSDLSGLEAEFVDVAAAYSQRKGITYEAWRAIGVEPRVLKAAGIARSQAG